LGRPVSFLQLVSLLESYRSCSVVTCPPFCETRTKEFEDDRVPPPLISLKVPLQPLRPESLIPRKASHPHLTVFGEKFGRLGQETMQLGWLFVGVVVDGEIAAVELVEQLVVVAAAAAAV
jgi:hypothetical protein